MTATPVVLDGYQSVLTPSPNGKHSLQVLVKDLTLIKGLEDERPGLIKAQKASPKNKGKRFSEALEPWEEVQEGVYRLKFTWDPKRPVPVVDSVGTIIKDENLRIWNGSTVRVAFFQGGYTFGNSIGTNLKLQKIQVISIGDGEPPIDSSEVDSLFDHIEGGFVMSELPPAGGEDEDEDEEGSEAQDF